jgi:hypothetical protein
MRPNAFLLGLTLIGAVALAACAGGGVTPAAGQIDADQLATDTRRLTVSGTTTLPDDACLLTQLMIGQSLAPDWPTECVTPAHGAWRLSVALGEKGQPPALTPGVAYELLVWLRDHPEVGDRLPFDLDGPPTGQP